MKPLYLPLTLILLFSCTEEQHNTTKKEAQASEREIVIPAFQDIIDSADVQGVILIYDRERNRYYSNDFQGAKEGNLPASTFKIPNSIIAIETGVV